MYGSASGDHRKQLGPANGACHTFAQADLLTLFARVCVHSAARWVVPHEDSLVERAFLLFLDYDGNGSRVEGFRVHAVSTDTDAMGAYAMHLPGERVIVLLFNKATTPTTTAINLGAPLTRACTQYRFSAASDLGVLANGAIDGSKLSIVGMSARSVHLIVLPDSDWILSGDFVE